MFRFGFNKPVHETPSSPAEIEFSGDAFEIEQEVTNLSPPQPVVSINEHKERITKALELLNTQQSDLDIYKAAIKTRYEIDMTNIQTEQNKINLLRKGYVAHANALAEESPKARKRVRISTRRHSSPDSSEVPASKPVERTTRTKHKHDKQEPIPAKSGRHNWNPGDVVPPTDTHIPNEV